ncbi:uncharacterized protein LOC8281918 [Ricinus communis]|uniref:uncharacterized protein LOC8281918 n=1 Tax=Ricinus communis TaxID=3988 RepID=UPI00201AA93F|nr:uncharacterized protein LOC8281918 [Ricinus communis]
MAAPVTITTFALVEVEVPLKSNINTLMTAFLSSPEKLPKLLPKVYKSIQLKNPGSLREIDIEIEYAPGCPLTSETDRVNDLNLQEVKASYNVVCGTYAEEYKSYDATVQLVELEKGGTKAIRTYKVECKTGSPDIRKFIDFDIDVLKKIDDALQNEIPM